MKSAPIGRVAPNFNRLAAITLAKNAMLDQRTPAWENGAGSHLSRSGETVAELVECVPNFSEGRRSAVIDAIVGSIRAVKHATILGTEMGSAAHRTVVTLVAPVETIVDAAFAGIATACERIDMRFQCGVHPRQGATDVCPLVPLAGVTRARCVDLARQLGDRVGRELGLSVYLYGYAARRPERLRLANVRRGGFETLAQRLCTPAGSPDFGPAVPHPSGGATAIGVRDLMIAYNVNLASANVAAARRIARRVRRQCAMLLPHVGADGVLPHDANAYDAVVPACEALGWFVEDYGCAQVTMNLHRYPQVGLHSAFEAVQAVAHELGEDVTGSEIVGLVPEDALVSAGAHYLAISESPLDTDGKQRCIVEAISRLGLGDHVPFDPAQKVLDWRLQALSNAAVG